MKKNKWLTMKASEKTQWFYKQCEKYNLTTKVTYDDDLPIRIDVNELPVGDQAYFVVFLPRPFSLRGTGDDAWHLEIGGSYLTNKNGGIWYTEPTMEGMEDQIEKVIELHKIGY